MSLFSSLNAFEASQMWYKRFYAQFVRHKKTGIWFFRAVYSVMIVVMLLAPWVLINNRILYFTVFYPLGQKLGTTALALYLITLVPGIMKRFVFLPLTRSLIVQWRRSFGVTMFLTALAHQVLVRSAVVLVSNPEQFFRLRSPELYGALGLIFLFPLWLTSNDVALNGLGSKRWKLLHRLTYFALMAIFVHVAYQSPKQAFFAGIFIALELASWVYFWLQPPKKAAPVSAPQPVV